MAAVFGIRRMAASMLIERFGIVKELCTRFALECGVIVRMGRHVPRKILSRWEVQPTLGTLMQLTLEGVQKQSRVALIQAHLTSKGGKVD